MPSNIRPAIPGSKLRARHNGGAISVVVEDHGIGIPERTKRGFSRGTSARQQCVRPVGSGVGLFLVATVVHLHGGEVAVESNEGEGSRFTVTLPGGQPKTAARSDDRVTSLSDGGLT